jgi:hypothetical protein
MSKKLIFSIIAFSLFIAFPASAELIGWWKLDEGTGNIFLDETDYWHDGTIEPVNENQVRWTSEGYEGNALEFVTATGPFTMCDVELPPDILNVSNASYSFWMNMPQVFQAWGIIFVLIGQADDHSFEPDGTADVFVGRPIWFGTSGAKLNDNRWHHIAVTYNSSADNISIYIDGELTASSPGSLSDPISTVRIGGPRSDDRAQWRRFIGRIDEVAVYNNALSTEDVKNLYWFGPAWTSFATNPNPVDKAVVQTTQLTLGWAAGDNAAQHQVYIGENYDDVSSGARSTDQGTTTEAAFSSYIWEIGKTYYWRIDEVAVDGTVYPGKVWSFSVATKAAYNPAPANGAILVEIDTSLSWSAGLGAISHDVYFGTDPDNLPLKSASQTETTYDPSPYECNTTYYWRVDEFDGDDTNTGEIWSFKTKPDIEAEDPNFVGWWNFDEDEDGTALDWSGQGNHGEIFGDPVYVSGFNLMGIEFDGIDDYVDVPQVFSTDQETGTDLTLMAWINAEVAAPSGTIGRDGSGLIWSDHAGGGDHFTLSVLGTKLAFETGPSGNPTTTSSSDIVRGEWVHVAVTRAESTKDVEIFINGTLDTTGNHSGDDNVGSNPRIIIGANLLDSRYFRGTIDEVRIYDRVLAEAEITMSMRGNLLLAWNPSPSNGAEIDIKHTGPISWSPGDEATQHDVYFGTDKEAVENADATDTTDVYKGRRNTTSFTPTEFEWDTTYYWRIDEVNNDASISKGRVWKYKIADYLVVDDFEDYDDYPPDEVWSTWIDGYDIPTNGSTAGYPDPAFLDGEHYMETTIVHSGRQSMPLFYDNSVARLSEVTRTLTLRNWTEYDVDTLILWYYGDPNNNPEPMFMAVDNRVVTNENINAALVTEWTPCSIPLQEFANQGVNLTNAGSMTIGFGNKANPTVGGSGYVYIDDIRLYKLE